MDTKYKCLRCTHKMAFNSKSTPTSPNLQRTTYHFVQKGKIRKRSACESKTIKGSIHVFTQEGNQCGLSLLAFSYLDILKVSLNRFSLQVDHTLVNQPTLRWKRRQDRLKTSAPLLFANKSTVKPLGVVAVVYDTLFSELYVMRVFSFYFSQLIAKVRPHEHCIPASR